MIQAFPPTGPGVQAPSPLFPQDSGLWTPALTAGAVEEEGLPGWVLNDNYGPIVLVQTAGYLGHPTLSHRHILCLYFLSCPWTSRQRDRVVDSSRAASRSFSFCSSPTQTSNPSHSVRHPQPFPQAGVQEMDSNRARQGTLGTRRKGRPRQPRKMGDERRFWKKSSLDSDLE